MIELNIIIDKLLDMKPDPIPEFILLKEFKGLSPSSREYQNAYDRVCNHSFVKKIENEQNDRGFWPPFHGYTENIIRRCLSIGLDKDHQCLKRVSDYIKKVLDNEESWDQFEKQDNIRWWPEMFVPLISAAMLSLIEPNSNLLDSHRKRWAYFAETAFSRGYYDKESETRAQHEYFGFKTKRIIPSFGYYSLILLAPTDKECYLSDKTDLSLVEYCMNCAEQIYYVYNCRLSDMVPIGIRRRDSRDFCHWLRALSLISQFNGWKKYKDKYIEWILTQRNGEGFWELPGKPVLFNFPLSNSWRNRKNRVIDSTIMVLRFLNHSRAF
ncbi:MAG TPA: hypothetical protein GX505_03120 [Clostridiales bacterium]|nr:hypothetical protein [Clostridiales bacterium]